MEPQKIRELCRYFKYKHDYGHCSAYGIVFDFCNKKYHFAKVCMVKNKHIHCLEERQLEDNSVSDLNNDEMNEFGGHRVQYIMVYCVTVHHHAANRSVTFKVDSVASCNVIGLIQYRHLGLNHADLRKTLVVVISFTIHTLPIVGKCSLRRRVINLQNLIFIF